jgi:hypothetical protein
MGGWWKARIVPCGAGVARTVRSHSSWASLSRPYALPGTSVSSVTTRWPWMTVSAVNAPKAAANASRSSWLPVV